MMMGLTLATGHGRRAIQRSPPISATAVAVIVAVLTALSTSPAMGQAVRTIRCGYSGATEIHDGLYVPYYLRLPRSSSASGNTAVRFNTCSTRFDSSLCVGTEWIDDAHQTNLGYYPICGNSFTPFLENFEMPMAPGLHVIQAGAYSSRGSGVVMLTVSCRPTDTAAEVLENHARCFGSRSQVTNVPTPEPTVPMPSSSPTTTAPPRMSCIATGDPHYKTFDGHMYDWMGRCEYVLMKDCGNANNNTEPGTSQHRFEVQVKNENHSPSTGRAVQVSWTAEVAIRVTNGDIIRLFQQNSHSTDIGLIWSSQSQDTADLSLDTAYVVDGDNGYTLSVPSSVRSGRADITLRVDALGVSVRWNGRSTVVIELDHSSPLVSDSGSAVCGLCGDANGNVTDDMHMVRGHDHWLVRGGAGGDDGPADVNLFNFNSDDPTTSSSSCVESPSAGQPCVCADPAALAFCGVLVDDTGPLRDCQGLQRNHQRFYDACVCDYCYDRDASTEVIAAFEADCSTAGVTVPPYVAATSPPTRGPTSSPTSPTASPTSCNGCRGIYPLLPCASYMPAATLRHGAVAASLTGGCECRSNAVGDRCYTAAALCFGHGRALANATCECNAGYGGLRCEFSDKISCRGLGAVRVDGTCDCRPRDASGYFGGPHCTDHVCGADLQCYKNASIIGVRGPLDWHANLLATPVENEPHLDVTSMGSAGYTATVTLRGIGGTVTVSGTSGRFTDPVDTATNIWITDQTGAPLCQSSFAAAHVGERALSCVISSSATGTTLQAHVYYFSTGLYSGPVIGAGIQSYVAQLELETSPYGVGRAYFHRAHSSTMQQFQSWRAGYCDVRVEDRGTVQSLVLVLQYWLSLYDPRSIGFGSFTPLSSDQLSKGVASAATALFSRGCGFNASVVATPTPTPPVTASSACDLDDTVELIAAILQDLGVDGPKVEVFRVVFAGTLGQGMACFDAGTPGQIDNQCLRLAFTRYVAALRQAGLQADIDLTAPLNHQYYILVIWILHYLPAVMADSATTMSQNDPHCTVTGTTVWCGVLGSGGSLSSLRPQTPPADFVEAIWVRDQRGTTVHYADLSTSSTPSTQFQLPTSATSLVVFQYSNLYGLWRGIDPLASHAATLARFTLRLYSATGMPMPWGRYLCGGFPRQYEPAVFFSRRGRLDVVLRGEGGVLTTPPGLAQLVLRIWIVDQGGQIICDSASPDAMDCQLSMGAHLRYMSAQVFVHYSLYGCWSGPVYNVAHELYVSAKEAMVVSSHEEVQCSSSRTTDSTGDPCSWDVTSQERVCSCPMGQEVAADASRCTDVNACIHNPCTGEDVRCIDLAGQPDSIAGRRCECEAGLAEDANGACQEVDACLDNPCPGNNVHCTDAQAPAPNSPNGRMCSCQAGYTWDTGECENINACEGNPCLTGGSADPDRCTDTVSSDPRARMCASCPSGYVPSSNGGSANCVDQDFCDTAAQVECAGSNAACFDRAPPEIGYECDNQTCANPREAGAETASCDVCDDGFRPNQRRSACVSCPLGSGGRGGECIACPSGQESNVDRTGCVDCPVGAIRSQGVQATCLPCPERFYTEDAVECLGCTALGMHVVVNECVRYTIFPQQQCGNFDDSDFTANSRCDECGADTDIRTYQRMYSQLTARLDYFERGFCGVMVTDPLVGSSRTVMYVLNYWLERHNAAWVAQGRCLCGGEMTDTQIGRGISGMVHAALSCGCTPTSQLSVAVAVEFCMGFFEGTMHGVVVDPGMRAMLRSAFEASLRPALMCSTEDVGCIERARMLYENEFSGNQEWRDASHSYFNICIMMLRHIGVVVADVGPTARFHQAFASLRTRLAYYEGGHCDVLVNDNELGPSWSVMVVLRHWLVQHNAEWQNRGMCLCGGTISDVQIGKGIAATVRSALSCGCVYTGRLSVSVAVRFCMAFARGATYGISLRDDHAEMWARLEQAFEAFIGPAMLCASGDTACLNDANEIFFNVMTEGRSNPAWIDATHAYPFLSVKVLNNLAAIMADAMAFRTEHQPYLWIGDDFDTARIGVLGVGGSTSSLFQQSLGVDYVESMWVRDQHGRIVFFSNMSATAGPAEATFSIATGGASNATSLVPYAQFANVRGLWRGIDCFSLDFIRATHIAGLVDASGGFVSNGQYEPGPMALMWTPHVVIASNRSITVVVRGPGGSLAVAPAAPGATVYVTHIWVVDQDGAVLCEGAFDAPKDQSRPWLPGCQLPAAAITIRTFVYTRGKGLWSGPSMTVVLETRAARYAELTSVTGAGSTLFSEADMAAPAEFDPYTMFDLTSHRGYCAILGVGGSMEPHWDNRIDAIWGRDQHGVIVYFVDAQTAVGVQGSVSQNVTIDLSTLTTPVTSVIPFVYARDRGLRTGIDPVGFAYRYFVAVLGLPVPSATGRYEVGSEALENEPYMTISSTRGAGVVVRGTGGTTASVVPIASSISNIWVTDQTGAVVCDMAFALKAPQGAGRSRRRHNDHCQYVDSESGPCKDPAPTIPAAAEDDTPACVLPASATTVQSHQFSVTHGLWSGPVLTVSREADAAAFDEMCSVNGTGPTLYSETDPVAAALNDPYAVFRTPNALGWCAVLGDHGSLTQLATGIEAIWARDQHGSAVFFFDSASWTTGPNVTFDVQSAVPPVASLVPYAYSRSSGLRKGLDATVPLDPAYFNFNESSQTGEDGDSARWYIIVIAVIVLLCCFLMCCIARMKIGNKAGKGGDGASATSSPTLTRTVANPLRGPQTWSQDSMSVLSSLPEGVDNNKNKTVQIGDDDEGYLEVKA